MKFYKLNNVICPEASSRVFNTCSSRMASRFFTLMTCASLLLAAACGNPNTPLDAGTRHRIDSTAAAQIRLVQKELNSRCSLQRTTVLPIMVDSIKQKRLEETREKLKTIDGGRLPAGRQGGR